MEKKKNISLADFDKKLPYTVPENYFEEFASKIEVSTTLKSTQAKRLIRPWMLMAAMVVGIIVTIQIFTLSNDKQQLTSADNYELYFTSQVDESDLMNYYLNEENNQ